MTSVQCLVGRGRQCRHLCSNGRHVPVPVRAAISAPVGPPSSQHANRGEASHAIPVFWINRGLEPPHAERPFGNDTGHSGIQPGELGEFHPILLQFPCPAGTSWSGHFPECSRPGGRARNPGFPTHRAITAVQHCAEAGCTSPAVGTHNQREMHCFHALLWVTPGELSNADQASVISWAPIWKGKICLSKRMIKKLSFRIRPKRTNINKSQT